MQYLLGFGRKLVFVGILTLLTSAQSLTVAYSKKSGMDKFSPSSLILFAEFAKLCISAFLYLQEKKDRVPDLMDSEERPRVSHTGFLSRLFDASTFTYAPPALFYFIMNTLTFYCLVYVDPGEPAR